LQLKTLAQELQSTVLIVDQRLERTYVEEAQAA
jgi:hypothetical protein